MSLDYKITGRRTTSYGVIVDLQWRDSNGRVVRLDLIDDARRLREQADRLEAEALFVPDQVELPTDKSTDNDVAATVKHRGGPIAKTLGLKD